MLCFTPRCLRPLDCQTGPARQGPVKSAHSEGAPWVLRLALFFLFFSSLLLMEESVRRFVRSLTPTLPRSVHPPAPIPIDFLSSLKNRYTSNQGEKNPRFPNQIRFFISPEKMVGITPGRKNPRFPNQINNILPRFPNQIKSD